VPALREMTRVPPAELLLPAPRWPYPLLAVDSPAGLTATSATDLSQFGIELRRYRDGAAALVKLLTEDPAAVLVPVDLAGVDLGAFVRAVVTAAAVPVIVACGGAAAASDQAYQALNEGARTLIAAPFTAEQLAATIRRIDLRYTSSTALLERGAIVLDRGRHRIVVSGAPRQCSAREFALLEHLLLAAPRVVSLEEIAEVLGERLSPNNVVRVRKTVQRLRRILDAGRGNQPSVIENIHGAGYRISLANAVASTAPAARLDQTPTS
jgi:DNA-binding response OmpR family regulator